MGESHSPLQSVDTHLAATVCVGNLPYSARVSELKRALQELRVVPLRLIWQVPAQGPSTLCRLSCCPAGCLSPSGPTPGCQYLEGGWGSRGIRDLVSSSHQKNHALSVVGMPLACDDLPLLVACCYVRHMLCSSWEEGKLP